MLNKSQRISKNQISWIHKKGKRFANEYFNVKFLLNKLEHSRYSIVVSKKNVNKAVDRNFLRRQLYEVIRQMPQNDNCLDYIIMIKPAVLELDFTQKKSAIEQTIKQISSKLN